LFGQFFPGDLLQFEKLSKEIEASLRLMGDSQHPMRSGGFFVDVGTSSMAIPVDEKRTI